MAAQWDYLLKNLGDWQGSFARYAAEGEFLEETPTLVTLAGRNQNQSIYQLVRRFPRNQPTEDRVFEYSSLGRGVLFTETGAFSQGSLQFSPVASEFGAELGLIYQDRRLRLVQLYNQGQLTRLTLIRERRAETQAPERPALTVEQLLGDWQGEAITVYPDLQPSESYATRLRLDRQGDCLHQDLRFGEFQLASTARISGSRLLFEGGELPVQVLLLPDGASCNCPLVIKSNCSFVLEVGWLLSPTERQRLLRRYSAKGEWLSLTLIQESKVGSSPSGN
ncbi:MAG: DUF3598 family protein [Chloroflexaceae bacterium]|nr:DUF3598 family protein [Chloroflexaceae bacterium]